MRVWAFLIALVMSVGMVALCAPASFAQKTLLLSLWKTGNNAYTRGNYREALRVFLQCKDMADKTDLTPGEAATLWLSLAETQRSLGMLKDAEPAFKRALEVSETLPIKQNASLALVLNDMSLLYQSQGRFAEAEALLKRSEEMTEKGNPNKTGSYLPVNNLARLYFTWGKLKEGLEYTEKAAKIARRAPKTLAWPYAYFNVATYAEQKGLYKKAEGAYTEGMASCSAMFGTSHFYYSIILSGVAELYRKQSRYSDAEKALAEVLKIREATFPADNPDVAETKIQLARVLSEAGKYSQARALAQDALIALEGSFGKEDNLFVGKAKHCLGNIYRQDGRYRESREMLEQALGMEQRILGPGHIDVAVIKRDLARVLQEEGKFDRAEHLLKESLSGIEASTGPDHPERAAAAISLAHLYLRTGRYADAEPMFKKTLALSQRVLGDASVVTADGARDLGQLYLKQDKFDESIALLQQALTIDEKVYGDKAPQVAGDLLSLATAYATAGKASEEVTALLKRAAEIKNVLPGGAAAARVAAEISEAPAVAAAAADRPVTDKWALVIGISNFKDSSINLKYAAKDATDFRNFLVSSEKFHDDHVKLLTDETATRENIIGMLGDRWLGRHVGPDDLVVVYVSSHGSQAQGDAGGVNFLVAHDTNKNSLAATGIPMQWLTKIVSEQVHSDRIILILDVCHSGAASEGEKALERKADVNIDPQLMKIGTGEMIICSSAADQVSWESKKYENSVFTHCLIESLRSNKDETTVLQAYKKLKLLVESEVLQDRGNFQTPMLWNKHWVGKDPALAVQPVTR